MISDCGDENMEIIIPYPISDVKFVSDFVDYYKSNEIGGGQPKDAPKDESRDGDLAYKYVYTACSGKSCEDVMKLIECVSYLNIKCLFDDGLCKYIALNFIKGKTTEEMRKSFNQPDDLPQFEKDKVNGTIDEIKNAVNAK